MNRIMYNAAQRAMQFISPHLRREITACCTVIVMAKPQFLPMWTITPL
jgi:hypothetical protein